MDKFLIPTLLLTLAFSACTSLSKSTTTASDIPATDSSQPALRLLPAESPPHNAESEFSTDFSKHSVPYSEILSGEPPKDGIPSIDNPKFQFTNEADEWLEDREPVVFVQVNDEEKATPSKFLCGMK